MRDSEKLVKHALNNGYLISVNDGGEWALRHSNDEKEILATLDSVDDSKMIIRDSSRISEITGSFELIGSVYIHRDYGDDQDIVDCTDTKFFNEFLKSIEA